MSRTKRAAAVLALLLAASAASGRGESALTVGVRKAQEGEYAAAVVTLRAVSERLASDPKAKADIKIASVYLGVAHLGLSQESHARRAFVAALRLDPALVLSTADFPPRVVRFFERVRQEALTTGEVHRPSMISRARKWLYVGGGLAVAGGGAAVLKRGPAPPNAGSITVEPPGAGIAGVTDFHFKVVGTDPNGDRLTYSWEFGDGATAEGPSVTHRYTGLPGTGSWKVKATVSDGQAQATAQTEVKVKSLNGTWVGQRQGITYNWNIRQALASINGDYHISDCPADGVLMGEVSAPRHVRIQASTCWAPFVFDGDTNADVDTLTGSVEGIPLTFTRESGQ